MRRSLSWEEMSASSTSQYSSSVAYSRKRLEKLKNIDLKKFNFPTFAIGTKSPRSYLAERQLKTALLQPTMKRWGGGEVVKGHKPNFIWRRILKKTKSSEISPKKGLKIGFKKPNGKWYMKSSWYDLLFYLKLSLIKFRLLLQKLTADCSSRLREKYA